MLRKLASIVFQTHTIQINCVMEKQWHEMRQNKPGRQKNAISTVVITPSKSYKSILKMTKYQVCYPVKKIVSMKVENVRVHKQKRLILMNLNELYTVFKKEHQDVTIGISIFCELRPKNYITVGSRGSHSVCVCKIHQNVKPLIVKVTYHNLLEELVVVPNQTCACPIDVKTVVKHLLYNIILKANLRRLLENYESVKFKQWDSIDQITIEEQIKPFSDFGIS